MLSKIDLPDEKELLERVANGSATAYQYLFKHYWDHIYSVAFMFTKSREVSQDLCQDIFARIWVKREKLKDVTSFHAYLFVIARNMIYDHFRKTILTTENNSSVYEYAEDVSPTPSQFLELKEMEKIIQSGIRNLPAQQQTAFSLSRFQCLNHEEIALRMGISRQSVKSHIVRAICSLRKHFAARVTG